MYQFLTTATNGMPLESALLVTRVTIWLRDNAVNLPFNNQPIWDARTGIGTNKNVLNAQQGGPSIQRELVFQFLTTAINGMLQEPALLATRDTASLRDNALKMPFNNQLI